MKAILIARRRRRQGQHIGWSPELTGDVQNPTTPSTRQMSSNIAVACKTSRLIYHKQKQQPQPST